MSCPPNATSGLGLPRRAPTSSYEVLLGTSPIGDAILSTELPHLQAIPARPDLAAVEVELVDAQRRELRLKDALAPIRKRFDFVLVDCPPSLGLLTVNALCAADAVLVPMQCEYYALEGLTHLMDTIGRLRADLNPGLDLEGVLLTMFDARNSLSHQVEEEARGHFAGKVFRTVIPQERAPFRGALARQARPAVRRRLERQPGLPGAREGDPGGRGRMTTPTKRRALGRGLESLLGAAPLARKDYFQCPIEDLAPQAKQPRQHFDDASLDELAASIREHGILQPIVAYRGEGGKLVIVAGERRWRAAQRAGLHEVPIVVRDASPPDAFELALVENLQREDLGPLEAAEAMQRLLEMKGMTQEALAARIGKDRTTVTNTLRLLKLPASVRLRVTKGELSEGHARALLQAGSADLIERLAAIAVARGLSVRGTEALVRGAVTAKKGVGAKEASASFKDLLRRLERSLGTRVRIVDRRGKGRIEVLFASEDERERLIERLLR